MLEQNEPTAEFPGAWKVGSVHMTPSILNNSIQHPGIRVHSCHCPELSLHGCNGAGSPGRQGQVCLFLSSNVVPLESLSLLMSSSRFILPIFLCSCFGF